MTDFMLAKNFTSPQRIDKFAEHLEKCSANIE